MLGPHTSRLAQQRRCRCRCRCVLCHVLGALQSQQSGNVTAANYIVCNQKLIVVLTVDSGDAIATQDLSFQLSCIGR